MIPKKSKKLLALLALIKLIRGEIQTNLILLHRFQHFTDVQMDKKLHVYNTIIKFSNCVKQFH